MTADLGAVDGDSGQIADSSEADGDFPSRPFRGEREGPAIGCRSEADGEILETSLPVRRHLCVPPSTIGLVAELPGPIKGKCFAERRVRWGERLGIGVHRLSLEDRFFSIGVPGYARPGAYPGGRPPRQEGLEALVIATQDALDACLHRFKRRLRIGACQPHRVQVGDHRVVDGTLVLDLRQ